MTVSSRNNYVPPGFVTDGSLTVFPFLSTSVGKKHVAMGVKVDTFPIFGESLLHALHEKLGDKWTPAFEASWLEVYRALSSEMITVMTATMK